MDDNFSQLIRDAFQYYDMNNEKYESVIKKFKRYKRYAFSPSNNDIDESFILFYDESDNEIFKAKYYFIGVYTILTHTWTWAWSIPILTKKEISMIRKVLNYGLELDDSHHVGLKTALITSKARITNNIQLEFYLAIAMYISKNGFVYGLKVPYIGSSNSGENVSHNIIEVDYLFIYDFQSK